MKIYYRASYLIFNLTPPTKKNNAKGGARRTHALLVREQERGAQKTGATHIKELY